MLIKTALQIMLPLVVQKMHQMKPPLLPSLLPLNIPKKDAQTNKITTE